MAISSLINKVYDASGAPSTQAFYGPYQTDDLQIAIDQVVAGWTSDQQGGFDDVPKGFKFGVIDSNNKFTEYVYYGNGPISTTTVKACAGDKFVSGGSGEGGSTVLVTPVITDTNATTLATITVDGTEYSIKAPSSGSVSIDNMQDSDLIDSNFDMEDQTLLTKAPNMKFIADLVLRVKQLETQLDGLYFKSYNDNSGN